VFGEPALDVSTTIGALGPPPAPLAPTVLRLAFAAPATPAGRAGGVDEAGAGGGPGAAPSPRPEFPAPRPEFPAPRPESPAAPGPSTPAVAREPGARSAAAAPPVVLRAVATGAVPSVLGPAAPFAASASRGPAGTGTLPLATADLSVESARAGDGSATAPPWTGRAAQAWPVQRLGARGPAPLVLPPAGPHLAPVPESPVVEAPVAVQRASEPPAPVQPAAQAGAPAPSGGGGTAPAAGPDQIDELVRRLAGPMLRRVKAELLLDRERRGVRTDIG
jgi:hypothetical protein